MIILFTFSKTKRNILHLLECKGHKNWAIHVDREKFININCCKESKIIYLSSSLGRVGESPVSFRIILEFVINCKLEPLKFYLDLAIEVKFEMGQGLASPTSESLFPPLAISDSLYYVLPQGANVIFTLFAKRT